MSLLIVEDDDYFAELLSFWLKPREIRIAKSFREAMDLIKDLAPKVVLLDLALPDSSPQQTIDRIGEIQKTAKDATVIVITGNPMVGPEPTLAGAAHVLWKDQVGFFEALERTLVETELPAPNSLARQVHEEVARIVQPKDP